MAYVTVTHNFVNGTTIDADQIDVNFADLIAGTSSGTKDYNIGPTTVNGALIGTSTLAITTTGKFTGNVGVGGSDPSASTSYPLLVERTLAAPVIMQLSNPSSDAAAATKIQLAVDAADKLGELAVWTDSTAVAAYTSAFVVRPNGNATRLSLIGGDLSTAHITFYVAGDYTSAGEALRVNADKSIQFMQQIATPATPASGTMKLYAKSDDQLYAMNDAGTEFLASGFSTGDAKLTFKTSADVGWVMMDDGTIGSSGSGASNRANADTATLYALLWNNVSDTYAPVSSGRGANAAADFAADKTLTLPRRLGRALLIGGAGSGLTSRSLGEYGGAETVTLDTTMIPSHNHTQDAHTHTQNSHTHGPAAGTHFNGGDGTTVDTATAGSNSYRDQQAQTLTAATTPTNQNTTATNQTTGGGAAHANMPPWGAINIMIKL